MCLREAVRVKRREEKFGIDKKTIGNASPNSNGNSESACACGEMREGVVRHFRTHARL